MTESPRYDETPVFFPAGSDQIFGVLTSPLGESRGTAVIIAPAGGFHTATHVNRFPVELARRVAARGYVAMRIDYHGLGESSGSFSGYRLDQPFVDELAGAIRWLRGRGIDRFVVVGLCFGGRGALEVGARLEAVDGLVMITTPLIDMKQGQGTPYRKIVETSVWRYIGKGFRWDVLRRFFPPHSFRKQARVALAHFRTGASVAWRRVRGRLAGERSDGMDVNPRVVAALEALVRRRAPVLFLYGTGDPFRSVVAEGDSRRIAQLLAAAGPLIEVGTVEGERAYDGVAGQSAVLDLIEDWLVRHRVGDRVVRAG